MMVSAPDHQARLHQVARTFLHLMLCTGNQAWPDTKKPQATLPLSRPPLALIMLFELRSRLAQASIRLPQRQHQKKRQKRHLAGRNLFHSSRRLNLQKKTKPSPCCSVLRSSQGLESSPHGQVTSPWLPQFLDSDMEEIRSTKLPSGFGTKSRRVCTGAFKRLHGQRLGHLSFRRWPQDALKNPRPILELVFLLRPTGPPYRRSSLLNSNSKQG
ncbi:uncharacterized protein BKA78DRAFT_322699 [Phyllosticta capitalensis]|uniref:uncharacterized protein n=1 Tax=Phyllosticta capitalensis TaxID=121624 RepID=UPI00312F9C80